VNESQRERWNSEEARHWVTAQERYDGQLQPFGDAVIDAAAIEPTDRVLDIGCGCGATTIAVAAVAAAALGADLSEPMLARARQRSGDMGVDNVEFVVADAQTQAFGPAAFDVAISRFGVMFFDDPARAFANIAAALRPGGRLAFVCWRDLAENEWLITPGLAAAAHLPLPNTGADGPGMFSLADPGGVTTLLEDTGFDDVKLTSLDIQMLVAGGGTVDETAEYLLATGIGKAMFDGADPAAAAAALDAVKTALGEHHDGEGVRLGAAAWIVTARRT
jgi:SAM-dependent methyltransferase